jgi:hypothetical protein
MEPGCESYHNRYCIGSSYSTQFLTSSTVPKDIKLMEFTGKISSYEQLPLELQESVVDVKIPSLVPFTTLTNSRQPADRIYRAGHSSINTRIY